MRRAFNGAAFLPRGVLLFLRSRDLWVLGLVPVMLAATVVGALFVWVGFQLDDIAAWLTPFADGWAPWARTLSRVMVGVMVFAAWVVAVVLSFAAVTNLIGQPFYEILSGKIETKLGNAPPEGPPWWQTLPRTTAESALLLVMAISLAVPLFAAGFIPVVGQTVVPAMTALIAGFFLSIELLSIPLERRGLKLRARLAFVWKHRAAAVGFGVVSFLLFLVPLMNIVAMPGAIVGGTLLVRRLTEKRLPDAPAA